jgi:hypothetical protein
VTEGPPATGFCSNCTLPADKLIGPDSGGAGAGAAPTDSKTGTGAAGDPAWRVEGRNMPGGAEGGEGSTASKSTPSSTPNAGPTGIGPLFMAIPGPASYYIGQSLEAIDQIGWGPKPDPKDPLSVPAAAVSKRASRLISVVKAVAKEVKKRSGPAAPYKRPDHATTPAQRASVQGKPCVDCKKVGPVQHADHKKPLVEEHYETGTIDLVNMRSLNAVQPQCSGCSGAQGQRLRLYSIEQRKLHFGE